MANNKKTTKGGLKAAPEVNTQATEVADMIASSVKPTGLDRNHQVDLLKLAHERFFLDKDAAKNTGMPQGAIDKINQVSAMGIAVVIGREITVGDSDFAQILRRSMLPELKEAMAEIGIQLDETKLLPGSTEETVVVPVEAVEVSEETKTQLKKDEAARKASEGKTYDPTKIKDEGELKEALSGLLAMNNDSKLIESVNKTVAFWLAYKKIEANRVVKSAEEALNGTKDKTAKKSAQETLDIAKKGLETLNGMSNRDVFREVVKLTGRIGTLTYGLGSHLYTATAISGSPISAFCCLRSSSIDKKTGVCKHTDQEIADVVKMLVTLGADEVRAKGEALLASEMALPEKDRVQPHIDTANKNISHANKAMDAIICAPVDFVESLKENYSSKGVEGNIAHKVVADIKKTYYGNIDSSKMSTVKMDSLLDNCTQYAGVISNLFRDPGNQLVGYSLDKADHLEFKTPDDIAEEKATAEKAAAEAAAKKAKEDEKKKKIGIAKNKTKK